MASGSMIADRIKKIRKKLGYTQANFAKKLGVSTSTVGMYEAGERIPRDEIKKKIANLAGSTVDPIFFDEVDHEM